jgi:hypothetical protein
MGLRKLGRKRIVGREFLVRGQKADRRSRRYRMLIEYSSLRDQGKQNSPYL